jgi:hypothetical protein
MKTDMMPKGHRHTPDENVDVLRKMPSHLFLCDFAAVYILFFSRDL